MDVFMKRILDALNSDGNVAVKIFPRDSYAVLSYAERLATEVVSTNIVYCLTIADIECEGWRVYHAAFNKGKRNIQQGLSHCHRCDISRGMENC